MKFLRIERDAAGSRVTLRGPRAEITAPRYGMGQHTMVCLSRTTVESDDEELGRSHVESEEGTPEEHTELNGITPVTEMTLDSETASNADGDKRRLQAIDESPTSLGDDMKQSCSPRWLWILAGSAVGVMLIALSAVHFWGIEAEQEDSLHSPSLQRFPDFSPAIWQHSHLKSSDRVWQSSWGYVVVDEGNASAESEGEASGNETACQAACESRADCESFTYCMDQKCYFKTKALTGWEAKRASTWCRSYFKSSGYVPSTKELAEPSAGQTFEFYMYRGQSADRFYPPENIDAASIGGVMWYLHNEVIGTCNGRYSVEGAKTKAAGHGPLGARKFNIDRIRRFKVRMKATTPLIRKGMNFGVLKSFDKGEATGPHRGSALHGAGTGALSTGEWEEYGFSPGCANIGEFPHQDFKGGFTYPNCTWYSLPGPCPQKTFNAHTDQCVTEFPGGMCQFPTGQGNCTYSFEEAGYILLDELVGITPRWPSRKEFCKQCLTEGGAWWPGKCGVDFWGQGVSKDPEGNRKRVEAALRMFEDKYPEMPREYEMRPPPCDFNMAAYGF